MRFDFLYYCLAEADKISFAFIAGYISFHFGGSTYLLLLVQYLFVADFVVGVLDAKKRKRFSWKRSWLGIKKIISLYFGVLVVGFGSSAFDVALKDRINIGYNGALVFDVFVFVLIVFELASINRHLARLGFAVNVTLASFFEKIGQRLKEKLHKKVESELDSVVESLSNKDEKSNSNKTNEYKIKEYRRKDDKQNLQM